MKNKKSFLSLGIIALVLFLGVGYAVVSSVYINLSGIASVEDTELNVEITNAEANSSISQKTVDFSHQLSNKNLNSSFTLNEMELGEIVTITYTVTNNEKDIDAKLTASNVELTNTNPDYFKVEYEIIDSETDLANNDKIMKVDVIVELIKTPVTESVSTTTVDLSLTASPKGNTAGTGSSKIDTPLKFGEKYYIISTLNIDVSGAKSWMVFYEDGTSKTMDFNGKETTSSGNTYTHDSIMSEDESDDSKATISEDGNYITMLSGDTPIVTLVSESVYNNLKKVPVKFTERYTCITDYTSNQTILDTTLLFFPDGSIKIEHPDKTKEKIQSGTLSYTPTEIIINEESLYKLYVSPDGKTITQKQGEHLIAIYELDTEYPISINLKNIEGNNSIVVNDITIDGKTLMNHKFTSVNYAYKIPVSTELYNTSIYIESENKILPYVSSISEGYTTILKFANGEDEFYIVSTLFSNNVFGTYFPAGEYISDLNGDLPNEDIEIVIDYTIK